MLWAILRHCVDGIFVAFAVGISAQKKVRSTCPGLAMSDFLTLQILEALEQKNRAGKQDGKVGSDYGGTSDTHDANINKDEDVTWRRRTVRKDGRTRTHKKKVRSKVSKAPGPNKMKEMAQRDAARVYYCWWLHNY
jgi:hypothetical protein